MAKSKKTAPKKSPRKSPPRKRPASAPASNLLADLLKWAKAAGADAADALYVNGESISVAQRLGRREKLESSEGRDLGLRVFVGPRRAGRPGLRHRARRAAGAHLARPRPRRQRPPLRQEAARPCGRSRGRRP